MVCFDTGTAACIFRALDHGHMSARDHMPAVDLFLHT